MSHFSIAINDVLDRMKDESATTRQQFAQRVRIPLSTFTGYTKAVFSPDADSLAKICGGLSSADSQRVIIAHLTDQTPEDWRDRVKVVSEFAAAGSGVQLERFNALPRDFIAQIEAVLEEAKSNDQIISFFREFTALLNLPSKELSKGEKAVHEVLCPPPEKIRSQPVPTGIVHGRKQPPGSSTPLRLNEEPKNYGAKVKKKK